RECLKVGTTVAVLGSGLSYIYPKENNALASEIAKKGALLSELPMKSPPSRFSLPQRNRLIAALSDAIVLTEAKVKSGSCITMQYGMKLQKPLFVTKPNDYEDLSSANAFF